MFLSTAAGCAPISPRLERIDVYSRASAPAACVILAHGFTRDRGSLRVLAEELADAGFRVVVPDLPYRADHAANARYLDALARERSEPAIIFAGFSAGAGAALAAAAAHRGAAGWIGLDPVTDTAAPRASFDVPAVVLRALPSSCNAQGSFTALLPHFTKLAADRVFPDASHCDFETPTDSWCRLACGAESPERQRAIRAAVIEGAKTIQFELAAPAPP